MTVKPAGQLPDYYAALRVDPNADFKGILSAYQREALRLHPELHPGETATAAAYDLVNEAYAVLSDKKKRAAYDRARLRIQPGSSSSSDQVQAALAEFLGINTAAMNYFDDVFAPMLEEEMHELDGTRAPPRPAPGSGWRSLGGMSGAALGLIVGNVPGMLVGAVAGYKLGQVRDTTGKAVLDSWRSLGADQRRTILSKLARKLLGPA
ncbi:hypothetical protein AMAG_04983 [Allomyces macrogynus ATCC 38327]|uniref:J domain-containing protein n=1 Tax=Allomyces macrogynus (strain ATCC 38327) TaxID=578462 RepID=A0A0L0S6W5_ALLM3|nr:hypothetical protein AMAG_04983 [Allomyces macrogynus ATCC 38327]|eukprot:KNE58170.1 hypothetical protein AMAG_04983 [Allomyces macrogynus ATCC 38327]